MLTPTKAALQRTSPEQQGIASAAVLQFVEALDTQVHEIHSFMLLRHGSVVAEGWWSPYGREHPHTFFSLSKSFTSTAVGLAIAEGHFTLDDPVLSFFPDEAPAEVSEFLAAMRVRHLLSMSTGHAVDSFPPMVEREDMNWIKAFFDVPVLHAPGTHFLYNTGATYVLSAIVQKTTGQKLLDYLQPRLFEPLGIENPTWMESPQGINIGGFGMSAKTEDIAKFGQLYLQKGQWQGQQLVPQAWVEEATAYHIANGDSPESDWNQGYGYQFWRCRHGAYRGDGAFGQYCIVMPDQDTVLAITGGVDDMQQPLNLVWEMLLPALQAESLPEDVAAQTRLADKLASLALLPVPQQPESPLAAQVSGRTYKVDANSTSLKSIAFHFTGSGCTVKAGETFPCGYGKWEYGQTTLFNEPWVFEPKPIVASGAWTSEDSFTLVVRPYETPFFYTFVCHFSGADMMIETEVNVSFQSRKALLTAHSD